MRTGKPVQPALARALTVTGISVMTVVDDRYDAQGNHLVGVGNAYGAAGNAIELLRTGPRDYRPARGSRVLVATTDTGWRVALGILGEADPAMVKSAGDRGEAEDDSAQYSRLGRIWDGAGSQQRFTAEGDVVIIPKRNAKIQLPRGGTLRVSQGGGADERLVMHAPLKSLLTIYRERIVSLQGQLDRVSAAVSTLLKASPATAPTAGPIDLWRLEVAVAPELTPADERLAAAALLVSSTSVAETEED